MTSVTRSHWSRHLPNWFDSLLAATQQLYHMLNPCTLTIKKLLTSRFEVRGNVINLKKNKNVVLFRKYIDVNSAFLTKLIKNMWGTCCCEDSRFSTFLSIQAQIKTQIHKSPQIRVAADLPGQRHLSTSKLVSNHELLSNVTTSVRIKLLKWRNMEAGQSFDSQHVGVHRRGTCNGKYEMRKNEEEWGTQRSSEERPSYPLLWKRR